MRTILLLLLMTSPAVAHDFTGGKVFDVLADYSSALGELESQRYAVCGRGVRTSPYKGKLNEVPLIWVAVKDGKDNYHGRAKVTYRGRVSQVWSERISDNGKVHYRVIAGGANTARFDSRVDDDNKEEDVRAKADFASVHPFEFALAYASAFQGGLSMYKRGRNVENLMAKELVKAAYNEEKDIVSEWSSMTSDNKTTNEIRVVFSKEYNYLPVEVFVEMVVPHDGQKPIRVNIGQVNTEWEKINGQWVPAHIETQMGNKSEIV